MSARIRITGTLLAAAESRCTAGTPPHALVCVELSSGLGLPYLATEQIGTGFAAHLAAAMKAKRLRTGSTCTVECVGLRIRADQAALQCLGVVSITEHNPPFFAHEPLRNTAEAHHD